MSDRPLCQYCGLREARVFDPDGSMWCYVCTPATPRVTSSSATEAGDPEAWIEPEKWEQASVTTSAYAIPEHIVKQQLQDEATATLTIEPEAMQAFWEALARMPAGPPDAAPKVDAGPVYVAGPMTGYPDWNHPAFFNMAARLRCAGYKVISPAELHEPADDTPWDWYLRRDLVELVKCTRIVLLPGWQDSKGAQLEHHIAKALGVTITHPHEIDELIAKGPGIQ
jgi:hypothetical protein